VADGMRENKDLGSVLQGYGLLPQGAHNGPELDDGIKTSESSMAIMGDDEIIAAALEAIDLSIAAREEGFSVIVVKAFIDAIILANDRRFR
jgi:hypothetical protein